MLKFDRKGKFVKVAVKERFWEKVNKNGPMHPTDPALGQCWLWKGSTSEYGYGVIWSSDRQGMLRAHRVAWELKNGPIPPGKQILHGCDNPPCVNPDHTRPGTQADNMKDVVAHGHALVGEKNPQCKITETVAREIKAAYPLRNKTGPRSAKDKTIILVICKKYGVSWHQAWRIAAGHRWQHING